MADPFGNWNLENVPSGTYTLTASAAGHLSREYTGLVVGTTLSPLPTTRLLGGDVNGDGLVNLQDISAMSAQFGQDTVNCHAGGMPADLDCNGVVDIDDITASKVNFGKLGPIPWLQ
jgi:hypothetical protein